MEVLAAIELKCVASMLAFFWLQFKPFSSVIQDESAQF